MRCLHCPQPAITRGVCNPHYQEIYRLVKAEGIPDEELIKQGQWLPKKYRPKPKPKPKPKPRRKSGPKPGSKPNPKSKALPLILVKPRDLCPIKDCESLITDRGLCRIHYTKVRRYLRDGKISQEEADSLWL